MNAFERILGELELRDLRVRYLGEGRAEAQCPAHDDRNPSLSVKQAPDRVLLNCHAGCPTEDVTGAINWTLADLFDEPAQANGHRDEETVYRYLDENDKPLFEVVRFPGKRFAQRLPDGSWGLNGTRRVLYRLPKVVEAVRKGEPVYIAEGEKDVHALERAGVTATCNPGGAGKWRKEYSEALQGAKVVIIADRDDPGRLHARGVAEALRGVATEISVVEPLHGKDVSDHLAHGGQLAELVEQAEQIAPVAPTSSRTTEPIDGAELLDEIKTFITKYMVLPSPEVADLLALWTLHTHAYRGRLRNPVPADHVGDDGVRQDRPDGDPRHAHRERLARRQPVRGGAVPQDRPHAADAAARRDGQLPARRPAGRAGGAERGLQAWRDDRPL